MGKIKKAAKRPKGKRRKLLHVRKFLNRDTGGAYLIFGVNIEEWWAPRYQVDPESGARKPVPGEWRRTVAPDARFTLSDCSRVIDLDFPMDKKLRANSLRKARLLRDEVNRFVAALEEVAEILDKD